LSSAKCKHGRAVCAECAVVTDAAKRISDAINLARVFHTWEELKTGWMAFALADGATDNVVYPSKAVAINHMSNEFLYAYVHLGGCLMGMSAKDAQIWLDLHRHMYDSGFRLADPGPVVPIFPVARGAGPWPT
jgi:hypothetical protein